MSYSAGAGLPAQTSQKHLQCWRIASINKKRSDANRAGLQHKELLKWWRQYKHLFYLAYTLGTQCPNLVLQSSKTSDSYNGSQGHRCLPSGTQSVLDAHMFEGF
jgi:hypothetical protein